MTSGLDWSRDGADWPHRAASRWVHAEGLRWHVQVAGRGPAILLLHGTGASTHSWRRLMSCLAPHATVVAPDLPGHAFTDAPAPRRLSLEELSALMGGLLRRLGLHPRVAVGHSAGAAIAVQMALDGHLPGCRLVALNGALLPLPGVRGRIYRPLAWMFDRGDWAARLFARRARDPQAVRRLIASTGSRIEPVDERLYARLFADATHMRGVVAMMARWNIAALGHRLPALHHPLHLVVGSRDGAIPPAQASEVRLRVPAAVVSTLPDLGHLIHEQAPARVATIVLAELGAEVDPTGDTPA